MKSFDKIYQQNNFKLLFSLVLIFSLSILCIGQTSESDETSVVVIPEQAMGQIVSRVLTWSFKPRNQKAVIYLAGKGLKKTWLPKIKGIEFQLLSEDAVAEKEGVHFFTQPEERSKDKYSIGFAFGNPNCSYSGLSSWQFRLLKQKVRLWRKSGEGFGGGCASSHDFGAPPKN